jgi:hypothetical protein
MNIELDNLWRGDTKLAYFEKGVPNSKKQQFIRMIEKSSQLTVCPQWLQRPKPVEWLEKPSYPGEPSR